MPKLVENMENLYYGIFSERSRNIADTCNRTWSGSWNLGCNQSYEGYGNDNPGAKSQGMKRFMAGGVALIGTALVPLLSGLFD